MEVSVEKQAEIARKISVTLGSDIFDQAFKTQLGRYAKNAKIAGFRKGKVPQKIIEQQFGGAAAKDAIDDLINEYYPKALIQEDILPAGMLSITPTQVERGKDFIFEAVIEVFPKVSTPTLKDDTIEQIEVEVVDADIDRTLESIQKRQTEYSETDKAAAEGNQLIIDFIGTMNGDPFAGGKGEKAELILGEGRFMAEFESNLMGVKKGDERTFNLKFPKDYHGTEVAGKTAEFVVQVKQVNVGTLPKIDDAFAKTMGIKGGIKAMRDEVRIGLEREMMQKLRSNTREKVFAAVAKKQDFAVPQALVEEEMDRAVAEMKRQLEQQGMPDNGMIKRENYEAPSKDRVKLGLIVRAVVETEKLEPSDELIKQRVKELAGGYDEPEQYIQHILNDAQQRNQITGVVLEEQVVEHLLSTATVKKVKKSYEDFMTKG